MIYFAYDITMDPQVLAAEAGCRGAVYIGIGYLADRRLVFDREDVLWPRVPSIIESYGDRVFGVVYGLSDRSAIRRLKKFEKHTSLVEVRVRLHTSTIIVNARAFKTMCDFALPEAPVCRHYRDMLIRAALYHELPLDYINTLQEIDVA